MFGLRTRAPRPRKPVPRHASLFLERLEDRLSPSMMTETLTLNITYDPNQQVTLSGQLYSQSGPVTNQTINLGGAVNGSATTDAAGNYSITLPMSQPGTTTAVSADGLSNQAQAALVSQLNQTPVSNFGLVIDNFDATPEGGGMWLFTGTVTGPLTPGEVVYFGGITALQNQQVNVNADGTFNFYCIVASGQGGTAWAQAADPWGDTSDYAMTGVNC